MFAVGAATDSLDGYVARRLGQVTSFGEFLDPLADKLLIGVALVALTTVGRFPLWAVVIIFFREIAISVWRVRLRKRKLSLPASGLGKAKTLSQIVAVVIATLGQVDHPAVLVAISIAVVITVVSGVDYLRASGRRTVPWS